MWCSYPQTSDCSQQQNLRSKARKHPLRVAVVTLSALFAASCGHMPNQVTSQKTGALEIRAAILGSGLARTSTQLQTLFDSLIIEISGDDFVTIRQARSINFALPVLSDTVSRIPAGSNRVVNVWTVNRSGTVVHVDSLAAKTIRIDAGMTSLVNSVLVPSMGSIYLQIGGIPTKVDSIVASFKANDNRTWGARAKRSPKVYLNIDDIPHKTEGILCVAGIDSLGDTLYQAKSSLVFNARTTVSVPLQFISTPGGLALQLAIQLPGATVVSGSMASGETADTESGPIYISEIMYAANDSEYIELHNPTSEAVLYDTLIIDLDGTHRIFADITIAAGNSIVIGRKAFPWVDYAPSTLSALDLSSIGNWITVRDKYLRIIDRVIFTGGSNGLEWPVVKGKQSIVLDKTAAGPGSNNYGRNWKACTVEISEAPGQFGTPRIL